MPRKSSGGFRVQSRSREGGRAWRAKRSPHASWRTEGPEKPFATREEAYEALEEIRGESTGRTPEYRVIEVRGRGHAPVRRNPDEPGLGAFLVVLAAVVTVAAISSRA